MPIGKCALCNKESELKQSHIIPKFVYRWHKKSQGEPMRSAANPNVRIQDGLKPYLLCGDCEEMLSRWENDFSQKVFLPIHENAEGAGYIEYKKWGLKFAVSLSWRTLENVMRFGRHTLSAEQLRLVHEASDVWKNFLFDNVDNPGCYEQHILIFDGLKASEQDSLYLNRYILGSVDTDLISSKRTVMTYTKLFKIVILGFIQEPDLSSWKNTRLSVNRGNLGVGYQHTIHYKFWEFFNNRADTHIEIDDSLSKNQRAKINSNIDAKKEQYLKSEIFKGTFYDNLHPGKSRDK